MLIKNAFININMARVVGAVYMKRENGELTENSLSMKIADKKIESIKDLNKALLKSKKVSNKVQFFMEKQLIMDLMIETTLNPNEEELINYLLNIMDGLAEQGNKSCVTFAILVSEIIVNSNLHNKVKCSV